MNFGGFMASIVITEKIYPAAALMYGGAWCWTMIYDSIYAY